MVTATSFTGVSATTPKRTRFLTALAIIPVLLTCLTVYSFRHYITPQPLMRMQIANQLQPTIVSTTYRGEPAMKKVTPSGLQYVEAPSTDVSRPGIVDTSILYAVTSSPGEKDARNTIRGTWAINMNEGSRMRFFIGRSADENLQQDIVSEMVLYGDIILLENVMDTYNNLTLKTLSLFEWARFNSQEDFIMKVDTDVYVKPELLEHRLSTTPRKRSYLGSLVRYGGLNVPYRHDGLDKWRISKEDYPDRLYPPHNLGFAYVISRDLAKPISQCLPKTFGCTAAKKNPLQNSLWNSTLSSRGGSYTTCKLDASCLFRPLRFEDVSVGGIVFNHLTGEQLRMDCPLRPEGSQCLDAVQNVYGQFTNHVDRFVDKPWRLTRFNGTRCDDHFIAMHRVYASQAELYYDGGEGADLEMCNLAPRGTGVSASRAADNSDAVVKRVMAMMEQEDKTTKNP